jgi:glycosyltransferase involved in cell wall biosynthesis
MVGYTYYETDPRVIREAEAAVEGGFEVDFLALRRPGTPEMEFIHGVRVIRVAQAKYRGRGYFQYLLAYLTFFFRCFIKTTGLFIRRRYVVIHVNNMPDFLVFSTLIAWLFGAKIILDIHDPMPNTFASKFRGKEKGFFYRTLLWQERLSAAYCARVITVHDPVKFGILAKHGLKPESVEVVANFADEKLFPLRPSFNIGEEIRFAFHGTILERSGLGILMNALKEVRRRDRIRVKIIGEGDFSQRLKEMIVELKLEPIVEFENRSYPAHAIAEHIADCHVGLVPLEISSVTDFALPLKLVEYICMGLPVVSVRSSAISYYLSEQDCMFFDWDDPISLSKIMDAIADNPSILLPYRERSVALRDRFSWTSEKRKYIDLLCQLSGTVHARVASQYE